MFSLKRFKIWNCAFGILIYVPAFVFADCADEISRLPTRLENIESIVQQSNSNGVVIKSGTFVSMRAVYDPTLETIRYQSELGRVPADAQVIMPFHHGGGTMRSHSHGMIPVMHILTARSGGKGELVKKLRALESRLVVAGEAIDAPGHGLGPSVEKFPKIENLIEWLADEVRELKKFGLPIVPLCRSASTGYFLELHRRYPDLIDGLVMMSPVDNSTSMIEGRKAIELQASEGKLVINQAGLRFVEDMYLQMDWSDLKEKIKNLPILILIGGRDIETPVPTREFFTQLLSGTHPLSRVHIEPEAGHEVLSVLDKTLGFKTFSVTQDFVAEVVKEFNSSR